MTTNDSLQSDERPIFHDLIFWHTITIYLGICGTIINCFLLTVFLTHKKFRQKFKLFICLAIGDLCNCLGYALMGISRTRLYSKILQTSTITHQSSLTCAADVYVWLRVVAALWPPVVQVAMGFDKAACVLVPIWYRRYLEGRNGRLYPFTIVFVGLSLAVALMLAVIHEGKPVSYYCGRKAAFTADYGRFLYFNEIFGYFFGLLSNATAYLFAGRILQTSAMKRYLAKSRYTLVISLLSSILVACPNILSVIMSQTHKKLPIAVSESAQWLSLANSSKNLFVYVAMSAEFRGRVFVIIGMRRKLLLSHSGNAVAPSANDFIHPAIIVLRKHMSVPKPPDKGRGIAVQ